MVGLTPARAHTSLTRPCTVENEASALPLHDTHGAGRDPHPVGHALRRHAPFPPWRAALSPPAHEPPRDHTRVPEYAAHAGRHGDLPRDLSASPQRAADTRGVRSASSVSHVRIATRAHLAAGTLPATVANSRSPGRPLTWEPLPAVGATGRGTCPP